MTTTAIANAIAIHKGIYTTLDRKSMSPKCIAILDVGLILMGKVLY